MRNFATHMANPVERAAFLLRIPATVVLAAFAGSNLSSATISFNRDIRPILSENCYACHGPDEETREADLRLDVEANAFVPHGKYEAAIIKGDPKTALYQRIITDDESDIMPPLDSHKRLTAEDKRLISQWIQEGVEWEGHWAFEIPQKNRLSPTAPWATMKSMHSLIDP